jgi:hypothetical protein
MDRSQSLNQNNLKEMNFITPVKRFSEKPGQVRALEILHSIAKKRITRLETEMRDLRSTFSNSPRGIQDSEKVKPLLINKDLERVTKEKNKIINKLAEKIAEIEKNNSENPSFDFKLFSELKGKLENKGKFIDGSVLEIKERLKSGEEVLDIEIDNIYERLLKFYAEFEQKILQSINPNLLSSVSKGLQKLFSSKENINEEKTSPEILKIREEILELINNQFKDKNIESLKTECFVREFEKNIKNYKSLLGEILSPSADGVELVNNLRKDILSFLKNEQCSQEISLMKASLLEELLKQEMMQSSAGQLLENIIKQTGEASPAVESLAKTFFELVKDSKEAKLSELRDNVIKDVITKDLSQKFIQLFSGETENNEQTQLLRDDLLKIVANIHNDSDIENLKKKAINRKAQYEANQLTLDEENKTDEDSISKERELELKIEELRKENTKLNEEIEKLKERGKKVKPLPLMFAKTLVKI